MTHRYRNTGKPPKDNTIPLGIEFANGTEAKATYTANQLRWPINGDDWDIAYFWRADGKDAEQAQVEAA